MTPLCPKCYTPMVPNHDGEWLRCPKGHYLDVAAEDCAFPVVREITQPRFERQAKGEQR